MRRAIPAWILGAIAFVAARHAAAQIPEEDARAKWLKELDLEAGTVEADVKLKELDLRDGVHVRLRPYFLSADRIHLSMTAWGVRVVGHGLLTFCPCDDPPIAIGFSGGWAGPPDELIVEDPTLRVGGVPVFWLPYLWLRSPRKIGLTTPDVSFRGGDGLFLGEGVHLPIGNGVELGGGVYTRGGFALTAETSTETSRTLIRFDDRSAPEVGGASVPSGVGLAVDSHGDLGARSSSRDLLFLWDIDAIRGARGLRTTLDLEPLARPYDRGQLEARVGPVSIGVDAWDHRGTRVDTLETLHPYTSLGGGFSLGDVGATIAHASIGSRFVRGRRADGIGDVSWGATLAAPLGVLLASMRAQLDARGARGGGDDVGDHGDRAGAVVGEASAELSLPFARALSIERAVGGPPVIHVIEPLLRASFVAARADGDREALAGFVGAPIFPRVNDPTAPSDLATTNASAVFAVAGVRTAIASMYGGVAPGTDPWHGKLSLEVVGGALDAASTKDAAAAGEIVFSLRHLDGAGLELRGRGAGMRPLHAVDGRTIGWVGGGLARIDTARDGVRIELRGAARSEVPVIAGWSLLGADLAPRLGPTALASEGATFGGGLSFPIGLGMRLGGDVDLFSHHPEGEKRTYDLLDVHSTFRYRHPCGCFRLSLRGGHVVGREGVDVFANLELTPAEDPAQAAQWW